MGRAKSLLKDKQEFNTISLDTTLLRQEPITKSCTKLRKKELIKLKPF